MIVLGIILMVAGLFAVASCGAMVQGVERRLQVLRRWGHFESSWQEAKTLEWQRAGLITGVVLGVGLAGVGAYIMSVSV